MKLDGFGHNKIYNLLPSFQIMPTHLETKEKIIKFLRIQGPSIPVRIAKEIGQSILFTSAFLSELLSEKKIKTSHMRVGSSPIYFISGQENQLEKYLDNIKGKEKEALMLLKEKKFLEDSKQEPAIRVALRSIKDFAIPLKKSDQLYWRYFTISESEFKEKNIEKDKPIFDKSKSEKIPDLATPTAKEPNKVDSETKNSEQGEPNLNIFDKNTEKTKSSKKKVVKKTTRKKTTSKTNEKFFNKVKEFLKSKQIEITEIEGIDKKELIFRINKDQKEQLLFAYNKKQVKEDDLVKANKKASEMKMQYTILCLGEQTKKLNNLIDAIKNLDEIQKIE